MNAVLGNNVSATSEASIVVVPKIKAGLLKAIATTYTKRISIYPSISTTAEQGYPTVQIGHWAGLYAPKGTSEAVIERMNAALQAALKSDEVKDKLIKTGIEPARRLGRRFRRLHQDGAPAPERARGQDQGDQGEVTIRVSRSPAPRRSRRRARAFRRRARKLTTASALRVADRMGREVLELAHDVGLRGKALLAAARRLDGLLELGAIFEPHLDPHHVAVVRAARGDRGVLHAR